MPAASIDIGSNTIRLLVGKIESTRITRLKTRMEITRLGEGVRESGSLKKENLDISVTVLKEFSRLIREHNVTHTKAVGTSALREARNSREFTGRILAETGINVEIISGEAEARLTSIGALYGMPANQLSLIIDLGGGSTEWILCKNSSPVKMGTIPIGVVKLFESCVRTDPPSQNDMEVLRREALIAVEGLKKEIGQFIKKDTLLIGTAGTITTLASIDLGLEAYDHDKIQMHKLSLPGLLEISRRLSAIPLTERKKIKGLEPGRADLIIPGAVFTINVMKSFGFENLLVSDNGLLEGVLIKLCEEACN